MATFPTLSNPTPDQWQYLIGRQVLGSTAATIVFSGIAATWQSFTLELRVTKDGTAAAATMTLNTGGLVVYMMDHQTSTTVQDTSSATGTSIPLTYTSETIAANRDGQWTIRILQNPPLRAIVHARGGYFRGTSNIPVFNQTYAAVDLGSARISTVTITSASGSFAASSAAILTGEAH